MKRVLVIAVALICCCSMCLMTGCDREIGLDFFKKDKEEKKVEEKKDEIGAPYIGYAPLDENSTAIVDTLSESIPGTPEVNLLKFAAGDNNQAIIRLERSNKDGVWETYKEEKIVLIQNVNSGYMSFVGNAGEGITLNTSIVQIDKENQKENIARFGKMFNKKAESMYACSVMFGKNREQLTDKQKMEQEDRMDLSTKKVLQMNYEKDIVVDDNGRFVISPESSAEPADINTLYLNEDGKYTELFEAQKMLAVTIEFENNEMMSQTPYICDAAVSGTETETPKNGRVISYDSGEYETAEICLEKSDEKGNWEVVGEPQVLKYTNNVSDGDMIFAGNFTKDGKITISTEKIKTDDGTEEENKVVIDAPKQKGFIFEDEVNGLTERENYVGAKNKVVLHMVTQKEKDNIEVEDVTKEKLALQSIVESGTSLDDVYKNKDSYYTDLYGETMYAITIRFIN